jgi:heme/copper-type cytochrome/quinol oxidase subunit 1
MVHVSSLVYFYPPLSVQGGIEIFRDFAVHLVFQQVMGSINIIVTLFNMRAPGYDFNENANVLHGVG